MNCLKRDISKPRQGRKKDRDDTTLTASGVTPRSARFFAHLSASGVGTRCPGWGREPQFAPPQIHFALAVAGVKVSQTPHSQKEADKAKQKKKSFQDFQPRNKAALYKNDELSICL